MLPTPLYPRHAQPLLLRFISVSFSSSMFVRLQAMWRTFHARLLHAMQFAVSDLLVQPNKHDNIHNRVSGEKTNRKQRSDAANPEQLQLSKAVRLIIIRLIMPGRPKGRGVRV